MAPNDPAAIVEQIELLNQQIEAYVRASLDYRATTNPWENNVGPNPRGCAEPACWEILGCDKADCPQHGNRTDYRCWLESGTLCGSTPTGRFAEKVKSCYDCAVFQRHNSGAVARLYENIAILIRHLGDKAQRLEAMAIRDQLTGLHNRYFLENLEVRELQDAHRRQQPLSLVIFDLDDFKGVNDAHGHVAGDHLLRSFARFLRAHTRQSDLLFRVGGDEFLLAMNGADEDVRRATEARLANEIRGWSDAELPAPIRFSSGGATGTPPITIGDLLREADGALYDDKRRNGR